MTDPMTKPLPLPARLGVTLMTTVAGLVLAAFVAATVTVASLAVFQTQLVGPDGAASALKAAPVLILIGALVLHRWLWSEKAPRSGEEASHA